MVAANPHIFRAYDIRGDAARDLPDAVVEAIGKAYGTLLHQRGEAPRVAVGRDGRLSSPRVFAALTAGLRAVGVSTVDIGIVPSPMVYFAAHTLEVGGGIMVTGSHNPGGDNGLKMMLGAGTLHGEDVQTLRALVQTEAFTKATTPGERESEDIVSAWFAHVLDDIDLGGQRLEVVVDAGNGAAGPFAPRLLEELGCEVHKLYCTLDGTFPNHHPDPTVADNLIDLQMAVRERGADLGVAYDGDGDRIGVVDRHGEIVWGDRLLVVLARALLAEEPGAAIVAEVKCSQTLFDDIEEHGGRAIMSKVGHSLIKDRMKREGALLAGEMSGHIFYKHRYFGFDDAMYTTARLLEVLARSGKALDELLDDLPTTFATPELRRPCPDDIKFAVVEHVTEALRAQGEVVDIDGVRVRFDDGWGLVRASNTGPVLVLRVEAQSVEARDRILARLEAAIEHATAAATAAASGHHGA